MGLAIMWSAAVADRVGEVALVPHGDPGPIQILGRGGAGADDTASRLAFARIRGAQITPRPPLENRRLSRVQLHVQAAGDGVLRVENVGRLRLEHRGVETAHALARAGDTLQLGRQLLLLVVRRGVLQNSVEQSRRLDDFPFGTADRDGIVGESAAAWALRGRIAFVGPRHGHVLIVGPSGTGKELVARAIHAASPRAHRPIVARNAPTLPDGIVDAELFGNVRNYPNMGAPERPGLVGDADGTSLLLDEFGDFPLAAQAHLLRLLDSGEYQRLGETRMRASDLRLIAATNRPISALRDDILGRMVFRIEVPGLDARKEDVPLLARHLVMRILADDRALAQRFPRPPAMSLRFVQDLLTSRYTTHTRQLDAILWRALEASRGEFLELPTGTLLASTSDAEQEAPYRSEAPANGKDSATAETLQRCLDAHNGVLENAWRELGLSSRHALTRLVRKHRIEIRKRPKP
jgi:two-component system nitrogen regulation response regulator GlnG/two-component system response regulator HydG